MLYYKNYNGHEIELDSKKGGSGYTYDKTIYTFDIETTSFLYDNLTDKYYPGSKYLKLKNKYGKDLSSIEFKSTMYIWMLGINENVYFGRTWEELREFLQMIDKNSPNKKFMYIHNFSFEFQYLKSYFKFNKVFARKTHKVIQAEIPEFDIEIHCTYSMTNLGLKYLPDLYDLPVKKLSGDLDYNKIRTSITALSKKELKYCENDCLVLFYYIKLELKQYKHLHSIPITATGKIRRKFKNEVYYVRRYYRDKVHNAINTDPYIFNLLQLAFAGGYTHANYYLTDMIIKLVDSWDFTSSYPYCMVAFKYPMSKFKKCFISKLSELNDRFSYLLVVKMKNGRCKYQNTFLSASKCLKNTLSGARYDNGRLLEFKTACYVMTDVDAKYLIDAYSANEDFEYEIMESYYAKSAYLPKEFVNFILDCYEDKTKYKDVEGKEIEYAISKALFNSLYGMCVTNIIRAMVQYDNDLDWLPEEDLSNEEIIEKLNYQGENGFLSFAWGVWITAYARRNLISCICKLDKYTIYSDTDSLKLHPGYNKQVIIDYNNEVKRTLFKVSQDRKIDFNRFQPIDSKGNRHLLGVFDYEGNYLEFKTEGAKKYVVKQINKKTGKEEIKITVAGVPKSGAKALTSLEDFKDGFVFDFKYTNKNLLSYVDNQEPITVKDYQGNDFTITDKSGCCLVPTTYVLGKKEDYADLVSSHRVFYKFNLGVVKNNQFVY